MEKLQDLFETSLKNPDAPAILWVFKKSTACVEILIGGEDENVGEQEDEVDDQAVQGGRSPFDRLHFETYGHS